MRQTNNQTSHSSNPDATTFWVVYDPITDEHLTGYDPPDFDACRWDRIVLEEDVSPDERLQQSARFESRQDAEAAAEWLVEQLQELYPNEEVVLRLCSVTTVMTEMVEGYTDHGDRVHPQEDEVEDDEEADEDEEYLDTQWSRNTRPNPGRFVDTFSSMPVSTPEPAPKKKKKKSAKSKR